MTNEMSYEMSKAFVLAFWRLECEPSAFDLVSKGVDDNERRGATIARKGMRMGVADILEMSAGYTHAQVADLDRRLNEMRAPTLTAMRGTNLRFVKKLRKRKEITSEEEFLIMRGIVESGLIEDDELTADLQKRLADYGGL